MTTSDLGHFKVKPGGQSLGWTMVDADLDLSSSSHSSSNDGDDDRYVQSRVNKSINRLSLGRHDMTSRWRHDMTDAVGRWGDVGYLLWRHSELVTNR